MASARNGLYLLSPAGSESAVFSWPLSVADGRDEAYEILDTIRFVCEEIPDLKQCMTPQVLDNCDTNSYESLKLICDCYNEALIEILKVKRYVCGKHASTDLLRHIIQQCYNRAVINPDNLNQYPPFSPEVYGETSFELIDQMIKTIKIMPDDKFLDLGSGVGQVVLQVAAATPCAFAYGIEKSYWPALYAEQMEAEFSKWMKFYGKKSSCFHLEKGDFLDDVYANTITSATVIFVNNFAFGPQVDHELKTQFANMKEGARIVSSKAFCPLNFHITNRNLGDIGAMMTVRKLSPLRGKVSWTDKPVTYYLHTIDRTMLEKYFLNMKKPDHRLSEKRRRERKHRLGRAVKFSLEESQRSDETETSSCTAPLARKRYKKGHHRSSFRRKRVLKPMANMRQIGIGRRLSAASAATPRLRQLSPLATPVDTPSSVLSSNKENDDSCHEALLPISSLVLTPIVTNDNSPAVDSSTPATLPDSGRMHLRCRRPKVKEPEQQQTPQVTKKSVGKGHGSRSKLSAETFDLLQLFHQQILITTSVDGYDSTEAYDDRHMLEAAQQFPSTPVTSDFIKATSCIPLSVIIGPHLSVSTFTDPSPMTDSLTPMTHRDQQDYSSDSNSPNTALTGASSVNLPVMPDCKVVLRKTNMSSLPVSLTSENPRLPLVVAQFTALTPSDSMPSISPAPEVNQVPNVSDTTSDAPVMTFSPAMSSTESLPIMSPAAYLLEVAPDDITTSLHHVAPPPVLARDVSSTPVISPALPVLPEVLSPVRCVPALPPVPAVALNALDTLLESFRSQYVEMLQVMQTEQYRRQLHEQINYEMTRNSQLHAEVARLEAEVCNLLDRSDRTEQRQLVSQLCGNMSDSNNETQSPVPGIDASPITFDSPSFATPMRSVEYHSCNSSLVSTANASNVHDSDVLQTPDGAVDLTPQRRDSRRFSRRASIFRPMLANSCLTDEKGSRTLRTDSLPLLADLGSPKLTPQSSDRFANQMKPTLNTSVCLSPQPHHSTQFPSDHLAHFQRSSTDHLLGSLPCPTHLQRPNVWETYNDGNVALPHPIDLTSHASLVSQVPHQSVSVNPLVYQSPPSQISSTVAPVGPVYSPISSTSGRSTPECRSEMLLAGTIDDDRIKETSFFNGFNIADPLPDGISFLAQPFVGDAAVHNCRDGNWLPGHVTASSVPDGLSCRGGVGVYRDAAGCCPGGDPRNLVYNTDAVPCLNDSVTSVGMLSVKKDSNSDRKISPNSLRWQEQIDNSFEALLGTVTAVETPRTAGEKQPVALPDWQYTVGDWPTAAAATSMEFPLRSWSSRHLECRSDSRDSGLGNQSENDVDRRSENHSVSSPFRKTLLGGSVGIPTPESVNSSPQSEINAAASRLPCRDVSGIVTTQYHVAATPDTPSPVKHRMPNSETDDYRLYGLLFKKKCHARELRLHSDEETSPVPKACDPSLDSGQTNLQCNNGSIGVDGNNFAKKLVYDKLAETLRNASKPKLSSASTHQSSRNTGPRR